MMIAFSGAMRRDQRAHLVLLVGIEAVGRLVEDQHVGIVQQRLGEADAALEALGQRLDRLVEHAAELGALDRQVDAPLRLGAGEAADLRDEVEKPGRRHVGIGRRAFGQIADMPLGRDRRSADVVAADRPPSRSSARESR